MMVLKAYLLLKTLKLVLIILTDLLKLQKGGYYYDQKH